MASETSAANPVNPLYGGIEAGGTKFVCAVGRGPRDLLERVTFATSLREQTLAEAVSFFLDAQQRHGALAAVGIASFGPIDCRPGSPSYGHITSTPKAGWRNTDVVGRIKQAIPVPVGFDTDVNAAALAEWRWGCARGLTNCLYVTVGTGIGGGFVVNGLTLRGLLHPEMGHVRVQRTPEDTFPGCCPFHGHACLEGLASGPAIEKRWGVPASDLPEEHRAWEWQAEYLAQALMTWVVTLSPEVIALGGGVMQQGHLFPAIRTRLRILLNDYVQAREILDEDPGYIRAPGLGNESGIFGALALAMDAV